MAICHIVLVHTASYAMLMVLEYLQGDWDQSDPGPGLRSHPGTCMMAFDLRWCKPAPSLSMVPWWFPGEWWFQWENALAAQRSLLQKSTDPRPSVYCMLPPAATLDLRTT